MGGPSFGAENGNYRHGGYRSPEYKSWQGMLRRCASPSDPRWKDYGGRGIAVCQRWQSSFEAFLADMGRRPSLRHSIERIDNQGPYSADNCRWATKREQARNRRTNRLVEIEGEELCLAELAERHGLKIGTLHRRLKMGERLPFALRPVDRSRPRRTVLEAGVPIRESKR